MLSESARMTTAEEARFRIDYPNSKPRAIKVVALDAPHKAGPEEWRERHLFLKSAREGSRKVGQK